ncbi:hypothetical protein GCM10010411_74120 [Actinomadura fulvescens]|uniref:Uncharacterized protein n=1 Tax=Actinomadura fulvescens TaxID=46160 RepID=A0ABP6CUQ1_9ACTN
MTTPLVSAILDEEEVVMDVPLERYGSHMQASLAEGLCPDCFTATLTSRPEPLVDCEGVERTVTVLACRTCGEQWWPADALDPGVAGEWLFMDGQGVRTILSVRTWDGRWQTGPPDPES